MAATPWIPGSTLRCFSTCEACTRNLWHLRPGMTEYLTSIGPKDPQRESVTGFRTLASSRLGSMNIKTRISLAQHMTSILRAHEAALRASGISRLSSFGSVARDDHEADSDVDLAAELDPAARIGLCGLVALERQLSELLGRPVDLLSEPVEKPRLRANIERDRRLVFQARPGGQPRRYCRKRRAGRRLPGRHGPCRFRAGWPESLSHNTLGAICAPNNFQRHDAENIGEKTVALLETSYIMHVSDAKLPSI